METIEIRIYRSDVYEEVGKLTDYAGSKMLTEEDPGVRDRLLASDEELQDLERFWDESVVILNNRHREMLRGWESDEDGYRCQLEVSVAFDKMLRADVEKAVRSYFIASIIGRWFMLTNKGEAEGYMLTADKYLLTSESLLYTRRRPQAPIPTVLNGGDTSRRGEEEAQIKFSTRKRIDLTVRIDWVIFDIMNETFLRGRSLRGEENHREVAAMFASLDEENRQKILRSIKRGFAEIRKEVGEYLIEDEPQADNTNYDGKADLHIHLSMPGNYNEAATKGASEAVHAYLVNTAIAEWYMVTKKDEVQDYTGLAAKSIASVMDALSKRNRPRRRFKHTINDDEVLYQ